MKNLKIKIKDKKLSKFKLFIFSVAVASLFSGCVDKYDYDGCHDLKYISYEKLREDYPAIKKPREIEKAGKIYVYGDILFINEKNKGIHVVDNSVKETPIRKKFIEIPGNIDIAVKDGYLYADSFIDLVILNVKDINNITVVNRKEKVFPYDMYQALTKDEQNEYICKYDSKKGVVVGMEK
jgi:hypothetical protein